MNTSHPPHSALRVVAPALDRMAQDAEVSRGIDETRGTAAVPSALQAYGRGVYASAQQSADADCLRPAGADFGSALERLRAMGYEPSPEGYRGIAPTPVQHLSAAVPRFTPEAQLALLDAVRTGLFGVTSDADNSNGKVDRVALRMTFEEALKLAEETPTPSASGAPAPLPDSQWSSDLADALAAVLPLAACEVAVREESAADNEGPASEAAEASSTYEASRQVLRAFTNRARPQSAASAPAPAAVEDLEEEPEGMTP